MKYETPELTALTPAIDAIQAQKFEPPTIDQPKVHETAVSAYEDWE
jgi:hypothetical protein